MTFEEFLAESFERLAGYARLLSGNRFDADDLLAEALLVAQRRWDDIAVMEHPAAYVRRIVTSRHVRQRHSWFARHVSLSAPEALPDQSIPSPHVIEDRQRVAVLLDGVPPRQRSAVILRYYLDLSYEEIGAELDVSPAGARTLVSRGLAAMRVNGAEYDLQESR